MAVTNGYCTVDQLREHLADGSSTLTAALLERAINASSRAIDKHCGRRFWQDSSTADRSYIVQHSDYVFIDDISTRTGVVVKTGTDGATFPTTLTVDSDYILEPRNADKYASASFDAYAFWQVRMLDTTLTVDPRRPTLQVTARHGWSAVPAEVEGACLLKSVSLFKRKDTPYGVAGFDGFGAVRITRADPDVMDLLSPFVIPGFA